MKWVQKVQTYVLITGSGLWNIRTQTLMEGQ